MMSHMSEAKAQMLIRGPVREVFEAFVDPAVTTKFWFTKSSGKLVKGTHVRWDWEMYGVGAEIEVKEIEENQRIFLEFDDPTTAEWMFTPRGENETLVTIINAGFTGSPEEVAKQVIDSTGGFTIVLCGLKALLEHGIRLNLVADQFPDARRR